MAVAVIGILVAIIIPAIGGAQTSARRAKTRVQFSQWSAAIEQFRQEYGYYPVFEDNLVNGGPPTATEHIFHDTLAGLRRDGSPITGTDASPAPEAQNPKRIRFCSFGTDDLTNDGMIQDPFGNTEIGVLVDRNLNGMINFGSPPADYAVSSVEVEVQSANGGNNVSIAIDANTRIRAGVAFYSAGDGQTPVTSW